MKIYITLLSFVSFMFVLTACTDSGGYRFNKSKSGVYELDLRQEIKTFDPDSGDVTYEQKQWRLDIPKAYIRSHYGVNGKLAYSYEGKVENKYSMTLFAVVDEENSDLLPDPEVVSGRHVDTRIAISIGNGIASKTIRNAIRGKNECVTRNYLFEEILGSETPGRVNRCSEGKALCPVHMFIDAWPVSLSIPRDYYLNDPQPYCTMVRNFLDDLTISRDTLHDDLDVEQTD